MVANQTKTTISGEQDSQPLLTLCDLHKHFGSTPALQGISLNLSRGQLVGLVGPNGSGKSTLMRCLSGMTRPDGGHMLLAGQRYLPRTPAEARANGVRLVPQELDVFPLLSVRDNWRLVSGRSTPPAFDVSTPAEQLEAFEAQRLILDAALATSPRVLLLDEPTATLDASAGRIVLEEVRQKLGTANIAMVSTHRLEDLEAFDRWIFLSKGAIEYDTGSLPDALERLSRASTAIPHSASVFDAQLLERLSQGDAAAVVDCALSIPAAVLGLTSTSGRSLFDLARRTRKAARDRSLRASYLGPERRRDHVMPDLSVEEHARLTLETGAELEHFRSLMDRFDLPWELQLQRRPVQSLSGGMQQKLFLALALAAAADVRILCDPTRGIDQTSCQNLMATLAARGERNVPIVVFSQDLPNLNRMVSLVVSVVPHPLLTGNIDVDTSQH